MGSFDGVIPLIALLNVAIFGLAALNEINPAAAINLKMKDTTFMAFILVRGLSAEETLLFTVRDVEITENIRRRHEMRI